MSDDDNECNHDDNEFNYDDNECNHDEGTLLYTCSCSSSTMVSRSNVYNNVMHEK